MRILKKILLFLIIGVTTFSIKLDEIKFNKVVKKGESVEKTFTLTNNKEAVVKYSLSIEEAEKNKNIEVTPKSILILPKQEKKFKIKVKGNELGEKSYYLNIRENSIDVKNQKNDLKVNMIYRFQQKYTVVQ